MRHRFSLALLALSVAACGSVNDLLPDPGQCVAPPASSSCTDYTGSAWRTPGTASRTCQQSGGSYYSGTCATANRVGTCRLQASQSTEIAQRFYRPLTAQQAQAGCAAAGGAFTAN